ncbi:MAG: hypothetical protein Q9188_004496 [Gyalolechia gomerana]
MGSLNNHVDGIDGGIPTVDFADWSADSPLEVKQEIAAQLATACQSVGFVYIVNHRISHRKVEEAFTWSQRLFGLKQEEKMLAPHPPGHVVHRGSALPEYVLPGFREFMTNFYWHSWENAEMILQAMAIGIGLDDEDYFLRYHSGHENQLRLLHYPPVPASDLEKQSMTRMDAHSDWASITMLLQDDCGGLQIENPNKAGEFMDAKPIQDAIVLNVGDLLQRWSNAIPDVLKSSLHRVTLPPRQDRFTGDDRLTRARYSIPYFVAPIGKSVIETLPSCVNGKNPAKYGPVNWDDYRLMRGSMQYQS